jgi:GT2 family glycosyltransferase
MPMTPAQPVVAVVIVNWNRGQLTLDCIDAVQACGDSVRRIVVVDNASEDGSADALRSRLAATDLLEAPRNVGYAAGNNLAFRTLLSDPPDYVWLLNNDARPMPDALAVLVATSEADPRVAAVGSVLVGADGAVEAWGSGSVGFLTGLPRHHRAPADRSQLDYLVGASLLVRWTALAEVGYFDERYFLYWEDTDLCFRLREAGWALQVAPAALVRHEGQASSGFQSATWDREFTASSVLFFRRHSRWPLLPIVVGSGGRMVRRALSGRWANVRAVWQGLARGLRSGSAAL